MLRLILISRTKITAYLPINIRHQFLSYLYLLKAQEVQLITPASFFCLLFSDGAGSARPETHGLGLAFGGSGLRNSKPEPGPSKA